MTPDKALRAEADVLVPCALGGVLDRETVPRLQAPVIVGAANNQLAEDAVADELAARGILWAPDFVANAGGIINISVELEPAATTQGRPRPRPRDRRHAARDLRRRRRGGSRRSQPRWSSRVSGWRSRTRRASRVALRRAGGSTAATSVHFALA